MVGESLAQGLLRELANGGLRHLVDEDDLVGHPPGSDPTFQEREDLFGGEGLAFAHDDARERAFGPLRVGDPDDGGLRAGPAIDAYVRRARLDPQLPELSQDILDSVASVTGETTTLSIPTSRGIEQIAQAEGAYILGSTNWMGRTVPYHASAVGKAMLAFGAMSLPSGALEQLTDKTLTIRADLVRDLESTRQRGYGISVEEIEPGLIAIGAPIRGTDRRVVAGIAIAGPSMRITPDRYSQIGELLVRSAAELEARISHQHLEEGAV